MTVNLFKFLVLIMALGCTTLLMAVSVIDPAIGMPIITGAAFYGIGNGLTAAKGGAMQPTIAKRGRTTVTVGSGDTTILAPAPKVEPSGVRVNELMAKGIGALSDAELAELRELLRGEPT